MRKSGKNWTSVYRFKVLGLMFLIQEDCLMSLEGNGMSFVAWNDLQISFQFSIFLQKFQVYVLVSSAADWSLALGLWSGLSIEWIRSKKTIQIFCIHGFCDLIFKDLFQSFFMCFCSQSYPINSIPSISDHARIIEDIICTKRFEIVG